MPTPMRVKRSAVQGKIPLLADLNLGELAVNTFDGIIFYKRNNGTEEIIEADIPGMTTQLSSLDGRATQLETDMGDVAAALDAINGEQPA